MLFQQLAIAAIVSTATAQSLPLRIVSFNIRYDASKLASGETRWWEDGCSVTSLSCRLPHTTGYINDIAGAAPQDAAVVFGMQEVLDNQLKDVKFELNAARGTGWEHIGVARDDGDKDGEYSPIIYNTNVLRLLHQETKWLSPTPEQPSFGWDAGSRRVVTIGVFEHKATSRRFIHANTHLDNASQQAREEGIKVVAARLGAVQALFGQDLGVTLTGDFNSVRGSTDAYGVLESLGTMQDLWTAAPHGSDVVQTYTAFTREGVSQIDFIWFGQTPGGANFTAAKVEVIDNVRSGLLVSDHRAVVGDLVLL
ncbi:maltose 6'-phosphate phosphatase [Microdochium nivale]|nr:maltose 6'-phosphate phosphatase [Microdochium nivale]